MESFSKNETKPDTLVPGERKGPIKEIHKRKTNVEGGTPFKTGSKELKDARHNFAKSLGKEEKKRYGGGAITV